MALQKTLFNQNLSIISKLFTGPKNFRTNDDKGWTGESHKPWQIYSWSDLGTSEKVRRRIEGAVWNEKAQDASRGESNQIIKKGTVEGDRNQWNPFWASVSKLVNVIAIQAILCFY